MSQSYQSLPGLTQNEYKNNSLQQILLISNQKSIIIQKFMQKMSQKEHKIQQLMKQIQKRNWQLRQKDYNEEYSKKYFISQLLKEGFTSEICLNLKENTQIAQGSQNQQKNQTELVEKNSITQNKKDKQQNYCSHRGYIVKIFVRQNVDEIKLEQNMLLIKDQHFTDVSLHIQKNIQNPSSQITSSSTNQPTNLQQIQLYCQSVLKQVQQMKIRLQKSQTQKNQSIRQLQTRLQQKQLQINKLNQEMKLKLQQKQILYKSNLQAKILQMKNASQRDLEDYKIQIVLLQSKNKEVEKINQSLRKEIQQYKQKFLQKEQILLKTEKGYKEDIKIRQTSNQELKISYENKINKVIAQNQVKVKQLEDKLADINKKIQQGQRQNQDLKRLILKNKIQSNVQSKQLNQEKHSKAENPKQQILKPQINMQNAQSQTDNGILFDINRTFNNRDNQHKFNKSNKGTVRFEQKIDGKLSLPPPSLDMIGNDYFDNSQSSQFQNKSSLGPQKNQQFFSNLSSSSFGKNQKHFQQMVTTQKPLNTNEQHKHSSLKNIPIPQYIQKSQSKKQQKKQFQNSRGNVMPNFIPQLRENSKNRPKTVASYSQKNIIVEEPANQDEEHNIVDSLSQFDPPRSKHNILSIQKNRLQDQGNLENSLVPSRSILTSSQSQGQNQLDNEIGDSDRIHQRDHQLNSSQHQSQTYKNSLRIPGKGKSKYGSSNSNNSYNIKIASKGDSSNNDNDTSFNFPSLLQKSSQNIHKLNSNSLKISSSNSKSVQQKASELLQMKSPEIVMKSILQKSFPVEPNPFRLSYEYLNVGQIVKSDNPNKVQIKKQNYLGVKQQARQKEIQRSQSIPDIFIQTQNNKGTNEQSFFPAIKQIVQREQSNKVTESTRLQKASNPNIVQRNSPLNSPTMYTTPERKQQRNKNLSLQNVQSNHEQQTSVQNKLFKNAPNKNNSTKKGEFIQLADSIDFNSLKNIQHKDNKSSTKKKQKIIYLRR